MPTSQISGLTLLIYFNISRNMKTIRPDSLTIEEAASTFAALGSEQRLGVLRTLVRAGPEGLTIGELGTRTGVTGSTLTHHIKILVQAALVTQKKQGRSIICAAAEYERMNELSEFLIKQCCADAADGTDQAHA